MTREEAIMKYDSLEEAFEDGKWEGYKLGYADAKEKFERPHGEWLPLKNKKGETVAFRCSYCGQNPKYAVNSDFCPRCGADMRKKVKRNENHN